jgi:integrase
MPGSVHTITRMTNGGKRYIVRYRRGGRGYRLEHAGSFRRLDLARERERLVGGWLALGLDPRDEFSKFGAEAERRVLTDVGRDWLESRVDLSEQSRRVYATYLDALAESPYAQADPARLRPSDVRAQVSQWLKSGLAPKSIPERVSVLRLILDFAEVDPNPARHRSVKLPARVERELVLPSAIDMVALVAGLGKKYRLPLVTLEQTAMRINEVVSLERDDVDVASLRFRVKAINRKGRRGSRRPRFVPVPGWLMEVVATSLPLGGRVFHDITANGLRSAMRDACERSGLQRCTPHLLRHRRISLWHFQGVPARELADRAGHSRPSMSLDVYSHVIVPDEADTESLKRLIFGGELALNRDPRDAPVMHSSLP